MSWHYLQEEAGGFSPEKYLDGLRSVRAKLPALPETSCLPGSEKETSQDFPFGTTSKRLMAHHGEALLTSSAEASPVKIFPVQGKAQELTEPGADFGQRCTESFAKYDPVTLLWKTPQCLLSGDFIEFSGTWPRAGIMLRGCVYLPPPWAHLTYGTDFGSSRRIPTPTASDGKASRPARNTTAQGGQSLTQYVLYPPGEQPLPPDAGVLNPEYVEWLMGWPVGWTALKCLETGNVQSWLLQHFCTSAAHSTEQKINN